jgi:hypothetical protein
MYRRVLVNVKDSIYSFGYVNVVEVPRVKSTHYGKKSFKFAAATLWNSLPNHFRTENKNKIISTCIDYPITEMMCK